jgi:hypothetical protein
MRGWDVATLVIRFPPDDSARLAVAICTSQNRPFFDKRKSGSKNILACGATRRDLRLQQSAVEHFPDSNGKLFQREGLGQEAELGVGRQVSREGILGITGNEDELQVRIGLANFLE